MKVSIANCRLFQEYHNSLHVVVGFVFHESFRASVCEFLGHGRCYAFFVVYTASSYRASSGEDLCQVAVSSSC